MSSGLSSGAVASYSATTAPVSCMRSKLRQVVQGATTVLPRRLHRLELSDPNRATSKPHTIGDVSVMPTSRFLAASSNSIGMMVSSSARGNSPKTRMR